MIGFDFIFLGKSEPSDDELLNTALENDDKVVMASTIDEGGFLTGRTARATGRLSSGIIVKLQDPDGIIRRGLIARGDIERGWFRIFEGGAARLYILAFRKSKGRLRQHKKTQSYKNKTAVGGIQTPPTAFSAIGNSIKGYMRIYRIITSVSIPQVRRESMEPRGKVLCCGDELWVVGRVA